MVMEYPCTNCLTDCNGGNLDCELYIHWSNQNDEIEATEGKNMGQYYIAVNKTKKQFLYPHAFDDGLKAWEIVANGSMLKALGYLLVKSDGGGSGDLHENQLVGYWAGDEIVIIGDYDSSKLYEEAMAKYTDISTTVIYAMTHPSSQDIFQGEIISARGYMKEYFDKHPAIPFNRLSTEIRSQDNTNTVTEPIIQHLVIDPDMLEIM